jgi:outer membrane protein TolC
VLAGCKAAHPIRDPDYAQLADAAYASWNAPAPEQMAVNPVFDQLAGPQPVQTYVRFALAQNPAIHAARKRVESAAMRVPQAASLSDPMLDTIGWPFFPNVPQTASGRKTVDMMVSQEVPWRGKLATKAAAAEEEANVARAQLAAAELQTVEEVKRAYFELYFVQQAIRITEQDRQLLADLIEIAESLYRTGRTSQQDVLRLQAELSNVDGELVRLRQMQASAQADLAQVLHVSPDTPVGAETQLPGEEVPRDLERLYQQAIAARPELHAMLAEIERDRRLVDLAQLNYKPDFTFQFGWGEMTTNRALSPIADGLDDLTVGLSVNLPVYRKRLDAGVREAEAAALASARVYDQMKDETQRDVKSLFAQATSQRDLELLFRQSIIPKTEQAFQIAFGEYRVGETEFAELIGTWRELLRFHIAHVQLESQLRQTLASLERVVGGWLPAPADQASAAAVEMPPQALPPLNGQLDETGQRALDG